MNNSSAARPKRSVRILVCICFAVALCFLAALCVSKANAADKIRRTVSTYLDQKQIAYTSVHVNDHTLSIKLQSDGTDHCTLDDVKAIQDIYAAVHAQSVDGKIKNVSIEIYNHAGQIIYEETEMDVSSKVENDASLMSATDVGTTQITDSDILQEAHDILENAPYVLQSADISDAEEIAGKCLNLTLTLNDVNGDSVSRIRRVYDDLEAYSFSTGAITQCNITLLNSDQECIAYMIGDFPYGNCIAWISPDIEDAFVALEGPAPDD